MSNIVYRYKWRGQRTGWFHYLEIIPASTTVLNPLLIEYRYLPDNCIQLKEVNYEMNTTLIGLQGTPDMKLDIDFNLIPDDAYYDEFYDAIYNPYVLGEQNVYTLKRYNLSTIFRWVPQAQDIEDPDDILLSTYDEFYGLMRKLKGGDMNLVENTVSVEIYDVNRWILEALHLDMFYTVIKDPGATFVAKTGLIEYAFLQSGTYYAVGHCATFKYAPDYRFWFVKREDMLDYLRMVALILKKEMLRNSTYSLYYIGTPNTWYYRQNYLGDGTLGSLIDITDLYLLAAYADGDAYGSNVLDGLFEQTSSRYLYNDYKNGSWDFLNELYEDGFTKTLLSPDGGVSNVPLFWYSGAPVQLDRERMENLKPEAYDEALKSMTASVYEAVNKDINKYEEFGAGSFNEEAETIPIVFNNTPSACPYQPYDFTYDDALKIKDPSNLKLNVVPTKSENINNVHHRGLYYLESASVIKTGEGPMPFRVHEYCETTLLGSPGYETTDILSGCGFSAVVLNTSPWDKPTENIQYLQAMSSKPKYQAKAMAGLWGNNNIMKIEFEVPFDEKFGTSAKFLFGRDGFTHAFQLSIQTELNSHFPADISSTFYMYKVKLDCEREIAVVSLISCPVNI